jgi:Putative beta barrel porin-7 (BBP7)
MVGRFVVPLLLLAISLAASTACGQPAQSGGAPSGYFIAPNGSPGPYGGSRMPLERPREVYEELADDPGFLFADTPLEKSLKNTFRHGFFRAEYLNFNVEAPPNGYVGAPSSLYSTAGVTGQIANLNAVDPVGNARRPITGLRQPITGVTTTGSGTPAFYDEIEIKSLNGVRGTYGIPLATGVVELSAFTMEPNSSTFRAQPNPQPASLDDTATTSTGSFTGFILTPVRTGNSVGGEYLLYDRSYSYDYRTTMYGGDVNFVADEGNPNTPFKVQPIFGFRYVNFRESFNQTGSYFAQRGPELADGTTGPDLTTTRRIYSEADNYQYGPQLGMRAEVSSKRLALGVEPKAMIGLNSYKTHLTTSNLTPLLDRALSVDSVYPFSQRLQDQKSTEFGAILDLKAYARLNVTELFSVYFSYNAMFMPTITRPYDNVNYNVQLDQTGQQQDAFGLKAEFTQIFIQAISVGGELRY